jgi:tetratricopeptide (TPR) repeat protein
MAVAREVSLWFESRYMNTSRGLSVGKFRIGTGVVVLVYAFIAWLQTQTWQNSITAFRHAVEVTQDNAIMRFNLGTELLKAGQTQEGILHLQESVRLNKPMNDIWSSQAEEQMARSDYASAIVTLKKICRSMPWDCAINMRLAEAYRLNGERALERKAYEDAFRIDKKQMTPRLALARSLSEDGKNEAARNVLEAALQLDPQNTEALLLEKNLAK